VGENRCLVNFVGRVYPAQPAVRSAVCRFHPEPWERDLLPGWDIFGHSAIRPLDYILRFATDSYLEAEVQADLFKEMGRKRDALYAWKRNMFEAASVTVTKGLVTLGSTW
jgi:hypothetical protein